LGCRAIARTPAFSRNSRKTLSPRTAGRTPLCTGLSLRWLYVDFNGYFASVEQQLAALAISLIFGFAAIGKVVMGLIADRLTARRALAIDFAIQAASIVLVFAVQRAVAALRTGPRTR
jgi:MFS family permease